MIAEPKEPSPATEPPPPPGPVPAKAQRRFPLRLIVLLLVGGWLALGTPGDDEAAWRTFHAAAERWQSHTDFRGAALEYCQLGSRAVMSRPLGLPAADIVLKARSLPFLPKQFAINEGSKAHYGAFSRGPLSAYLYLCGEQSVPNFVSALEHAGNEVTTNLAAPRQFLEEFKTDFPVCKDAGAIESARSLILDVGQKPLAIRENVGARLLPHIREIARVMDVPQDPAEMSPAQQAAVLERLDSRVRMADPELWRTKQLSDFCAGIWAQVSGPEYGYLITPFVCLRMVGIALVILVLLLWILRLRRALRLHTR